MDTTLLLLLNGAYQRVDIFEDIQITITIQQNDLNLLNSRRAPYSKIIQIPSTSNNDILFEHFFEPNGIDFNPLFKVPAVVQYRGTDIFSGILRLSSVISTSGKRYYEVYILGEVSDFATEFKDVLLQDLNWSELTHELNYSAITTSWEANGDGISGLFNGDVIYPLINYGLEYPGTSTASTYSISFGLDNSFDQSGYAIPPEHFKPAIRVKYVLDKIFSTTQYKVNSSFFDTDYFRGIYMDTFLNGKLGITTASAVTNQNIFLAQRQQQTLEYDGNRVVPFPFDKNIAGCYDPLGNFSNAGTIYDANNSFYIAPYAGQYSFNVKFGFRPTEVTILRGSINILAQVNGVTQYTSPEISLVTISNTQNINLFINLNLQTGDSVRLMIQENKSPIKFAGEVGYTGYMIKPFVSGDIDVLPSWDLYNSPSLVGQQIVDFKLGVPNINCFEFFRSMITMFNLIVIQDDTTKEILIEPYNWYYNNDDRTTRDFTNILDTNSAYKVEPLSYDLSKELTWTNTFTDYEFLNKQFTDTNDFVYGRYRFTAEGNILEGKQEYVLPFGSCPTSGITNGPNFIIPKFYYLNNGLETGYSTKPHLFFWCGNRYAYKDEYKEIPGYWYLLSGTTGIQQTTYPCVSHLSTIDSLFADVISDLNFQPTFDFFGNSNTQIQQFTPYNLYNLWWETYINNIYSPETRRVSGNFFLRPIDIYNIKLNDKIFIKDGNYTIEKISDANLVDKVLTNVNLIKDIYPYYKVIPPAPYYVLSPNEPYPGLQPAYNYMAYLSTNSQLVCEGTTPTITPIVSFNGVVENGSRLWYDVGGYYSVIPLGTFVRTTISADTFVVVDNYGSILQYNC
jgi:hypothetical protein